MFLLVIYLVGYSTYINLSIIELRNAITTSIYSLSRLKWAIIVNRVLKLIDLTTEVNV